MRKYFPDYYEKRPKADVDALWKTALFSFDTSVILELFVLSEAARNTWLKILQAIDSDRLWLTYQAAREYHINVDSVIKEQCESTVTRVQQRFDLAKQADLQSFIDKNEFFLGQDSKTVLQDFAAIFKTQRKALTKKTNELKKTYLANCESTKVQIADLFDKKVTPAWTIDKLAKEHPIAEIRRKQAIPPGYMDYEKPTNIDGDYFVWRQLIELAKDNKHPIIFVTKDLKEDWFTPSIRKDDARTPRSELRQEMLADAGQDFLLYSFHEFFEEAKIRFKIDASKAVSDEVKKAEREETTWHSTHLLKPGQTMLVSPPASGMGWAQSGGMGWLPSTITYTQAEDRIINRNATARPSQMSYEEIIELYNEMRRDEDSNDDANDIEAGDDD